MMNIIRDEEFGGLFMIPLFCDWGVRRCNVEGCKEKPTTIITAIEDTPVIGMCEKHFQSANKPDGGKKRFTFVWDGYDAFKAGE